MKITDGIKLGLGWIIAKCIWNGGFMALDAIDHILELAQNGLSKENQNSSETTET